MVKSSFERRAKLDGMPGMRSPILDDARPPPLGQHGARSHACRRRRTAQEDEVADIKAAIFTEHGGHRILISSDGPDWGTPPIASPAFYNTVRPLVCMC